MIILLVSLFGVMYMIGLCNDLILASFSVGNFNCFVVAGWTLKMSFTFEENLVLCVASVISYRNGLKNMEKVFRSVKFYMKILDGQEPL